MKRDMYILRYEDDWQILGIFRTLDEAMNYAASDWIDIKREDWMPPDPETIGSLWWEFKHDGNGLPWYIIGYDYD